MQHKNIVRKYLRKNRVFRITTWRHCDLYIVTTVYNIVRRNVFGERVARLNLLASIIIHCNNREDVYGFIQKYAVGFSKDIRKNLQTNNVTHTHTRLPVG